MLQEKKNKKTQPKQKIFGGEGKKLMHQMLLKEYLAINYTEFVLICIFNAI